MSTGNHQKREHISRSSIEFQYHSTHEIQPQYPLDAMIF